MLLEPPPLSPFPQKRCCTISIALLGFILAGIASAQTGIVAEVAGGAYGGFGGDSGPATAGQLSNASGVAVDRQGNLYIADTGNNRIRKVAAGSAIITTIAGNGCLGSGPRPNTGCYNSDGIPATIASLNIPIGVAVDGVGNVFIADSGNHRVRRVDVHTGIITTIAGNGGSGFAGDGAPAIGATFGIITGVAADYTGNLYISEVNALSSNQPSLSSGGRIRYVNAETGIITTVAGNGSAAFCGDGGPAIGACMGPSGVALDSSGNLYIADTYNNRIRIVNSAGIITTITGNGCASSGGGCFGGDGGPAISAGLSTPAGVAVDSNGNVYIADEGNYRVRKIAAGTGIISTVVASYPSAAIATDAGGNVYAVAGSGNIIIEVFFGSGPVVISLSLSSVTAGAPAFNLTITGANFAAGSTVFWNGSPVPATFVSPTQLTASVPASLLANPGFGSITVSNPGSTASNAVALTVIPPFVPVVSALNPNSVAAGSAGFSLNVYGNDFANGAVVYWNGTRLSASVMTAMELSVSVAASLLATVGSVNIAVSNPDGTLSNSATFTIVPGGVGALQAGLIATVAGNGTIGFGGDGGPADAANLFSPSGVATDRQGNLYIADTSNYRIRKVNALTGIITTVAGNGCLPTGICFSGDGGPATTAALYRPLGVAVDGGGNLYIADTGNMRIRRVDATSGVITTVAGNGCIATGALCSLGDGGPATSAALFYPSGVALDSSGNLYIADAQENLVRKVDAASGIISSIAGNATPGFSGDGTAAIFANLSSPGGVAVDAAGNIYISDSANQRIRKVDAATGIISTVAGNGCSNSLYVGGAVSGCFNGDGIPAISASLNNPYGVVVDGSGNLYILDTGNQRVRRVDASTGIITTVAGDGALGFSGDGGAAILATLDQPTGAALDSAGNLYIADSQNYRIREVFSAPTILPNISFLTPASIPAGAPAFTLTVTGSGFSTGALVLWNGAVLPTTFVSATQLTVSIPANFVEIPGTAAVGVISGRVTTNSVGFTSTAVALTSLNPAQTTAGGASLTLTVNGSGFVSGLPVYWNGSALSTTFVNATQVTALVPASLIANAGIANVTVGNPGGTGPVSNSLTFTIGVGSTPLASAGIIITAAGNGPAVYINGSKLGGGALGFISGVAVDAAGNLYLAEGSLILKAAAGSGIITTYAGNGCALSEFTSNCYSGDGGPALAAGFNGAKSVAVDGSGNLFIGDVGRIRRVDAITHIITTVAGGGTFSTGIGDGGLAIGAFLGSQDGVALDGSGNLYIADGYDARIRKVDAATGIVSTVAGSGCATVPFLPCFSGDGGAATNAQLTQPSAVAIDSSGNLYITDTGNNRIRKVSAATGIITTLAGNSCVTFVPFTNLNPGCYGGDGGAANEASLNVPGGVAVDASGNVYIADTANNRIREVIAATGIITTVAGNGTAAYNGDGGPAINASLNQPNAVTIGGNGSIYIADTSNSAVREVFFGSTPVLASLSSTSAFQGGASFTLTVAGGNFVSGSTVNWNGSPLPTTFVSASQLTASIPANLLASVGTALVTVANPAATGSAVSNSLAFTVNPPFIPVVTGISPTSITAGGAAFTLSVFGNDFASASKIYWNGTAIASNATSLLSGTQLTASITANLIANPGTATVMVVNPDGTASNSVTFTIVPNVPVQGQAGVIGTISVNPSSNSNCQIPSIPLFGGATVAYPNGVADSSGNIYILGSIANTFTFELCKIDTATGTVTVVAGGGSPSSGIGDGGPATSASISLTAGFTGPGTNSSYSAFPSSDFVAIDGGGNVYLADAGNYRIRKVTAATGIISTVAGNGTFGYSGDGGPAVAAELDRPTGVLVDGGGNLYILDAYRIRKVDAGTGIITTVAGNLNPASCISPSGDGGPAVSATISPVSAAIDGSGNLFIGDSCSQSIRKVDAKTGIITTVAGLARSNGGGMYNGDGIPATSAGLTGTSSVALDGSGNLYIADTGANRIRKVDAVTGIITTVAGNGIAANTGDGALAIYASLTGPTGVSLDNAGNLYIEDAGNAHMRKVFSGAAAVPTVSSFNPEHAQAGQTFTLTVTGAGFVPGAVVYRGGVALVTTFVSPTQLTALVPANLLTSPGPVAITVVSNGLATGLAVIFVDASISSLSPPWAAAGGGAFTLTVNGIFGTQQAYWNGSPLQTLSTSGTQMTVNVPASLIATTGTAIVTISGGFNSVAFPILAQGVSFTTAQRIAHVADGAGWTTTFAIENLDSVPVSYAYNFWADDGTALPIQLVNIDGTPAANAGTLAVGATYFAQSPGISPTLLQGWAEAASSGKVGVMALFNYTAPGIPASQGTVIGAASASNISLPYDNTQGYIVGVALANSNPTQPLTVGLTFETDQGTQSSGQVTLPAHGHTAFVLGNSFPATAGTRGSITVSASSADLSVLGERFTPTLSFTTLGTFASSFASASGQPVAIASLSPSQATAGAAAFTLTVNGAGFVPGAVVDWNSSPLSTTFVSATQVTALVPASLIANAGSAALTVQIPGGTVSGPVTFPILLPGASFTNTAEIAHIADGAGWTTTFALQNLDVVPVNYALNFWGDDGAALPIQLVRSDGTPASVSGTLAVGTTYFAQSPGISQSLTEGWAEASSSGKVGVTTLFKYTAPGVPDSQGSVIGTAAASDISMPYDNTQGYIMGVALANTNTTQRLTIGLTFETDQGTQSTGQITIPAHGHIAFVLANSFPATAGTRGSIHFTTTAPNLTVLGERFTPSLSFTTLGTFQ